MKKVYVLIAGVSILGVYQSKEKAERMAVYLDDPYLDIIETNLI